MLKNKQQDTIIILTRIEPMQSGRNQNLQYPSTLKKALVAISVILVAIALTQTPVYLDMEGGEEGGNSLILFLLGWAGILFTGAASTFPWLANPLLVLSWISIFKNVKRTLLTSTLSAFFAASFLLFDKVVTSEAPSYSKIIRYGPGYWLWLLSITVFAVGTLIIFLITKGKQRSNRLQVQNV